VLLPQVRIEVVISEVALRDQGQRGIDSFGIDWNKNKNGALEFKVDGPTASGFDNKLFELTAGGNNLSNATIAAVLNTAERDSDVSILSAPTIVTTHNQEGKIEVVQQRPILAQQNTDTTNTNSITSTINYKDIGIVLTVKPLIGLNGIIQMEITQRVENVVATQVINNIEQPIIGKREAKSFVSVNDGEMIILGGLQENIRSESKNKMFLLGQLPIIGGLFTSDTHDYERRELIIFIVPHLISNTVAGNRDAELLISRSENKEQVLTYVDTGKFPEIKTTNEPKKKKRKMGPNRA
jgi:general secretion pathway protein D